MERKIKVLWFCNTPANADEYYNYLLKSTGGWLKTLNQVLEDEIELYVAFYGLKNESFKFQNTFYFSINIKNNLLKRVIKRSFPYLYDTNLNELLDIVNKVRPDLIHIHGIENNFIDIIDKVEMPVVLSIQGNINSIYNKYCSGLNRKYLRYKKREFNSLKNIFFPWTFNVEYKYFKVLKERESKRLKEVKYIFGRTDWDYYITRVFSPNSMYFKEDRIFRKEFYDAEWILKKNSKMVIHTTSSNSYYKGLETICNSIIELKRLGYDINWQIAGVNENDLIVSVLKKIFGRNFPHQNLIFLGKLGSEELISNMKKADMYVMPSHIENNANNLGEAMIIGMPCLSAYTGGLGSIINNNYNGLFFQDGDYLALSGIIIELYNNSTLAVKLGKNAREYALEKHNPQKIKNEVLENYKIIINKNI